MFDLERRRLRSSSDFTTPLAVVSAALIALLVLGAMLLITRFDDDAQQREEMIVAHGVHDKIGEIASTVLPQVMWDDAVRHLDNRLDRLWADDNIGAYLNKTGGFDELFILDARDRPVYASIVGARAELTTFAPFAATVAPLVAKVRDSERARGRLPSAPPRYGVLAAPIQADGVANVEGRSYIVIATLVQPDFGKARPAGATAPILLSAMWIDQSLLDTLASRFRLEGIHLHEADSRFEPDEAHAALRDGQGRYVATLDWLPDRPGHRLLRSIAPAVGSIAMVMLALLLLFHRRTGAIARSLIASEARSTHMALHDMLTGLPNRGSFLARLGRALAELGRFPGTVIVHCIDLDRFKEINDTMGHLAGDELIRAAAQRMTGLCRPSEFFARLSGDEFAIVQTRADARAAASLAARLCEAMGQPFDLSCGRMFTGASIGIAMTGDSYADPSELYRQADLALYRAKKEARGSFCLFEPDMDAAIKSRRAVEADLRDALASDRGLRLVYQPQVDGSGMMTGAEALLRWDHPQRGEVSPAFFIPIAEECGLINQLGLLTLRRAFEDSRRWPGLRIGINLSAVQLRMQDFLPSLRMLIALCGIDPANFELEITEGVLLRDDPETHETLSQLRQLGFTLALDDFGTGYSSLSYLRRYPIDRIKIDRSFIIKLGMERECDQVVSAIVRLARALKLSVIAEGVETPCQRASLARAGCTEVQGFLFARPMPADSIDTLWAHPRPCLPMANVAN
jgi:diguanylate cyclase (GGDEF)-like protein